MKVYKNHCIHLASRVEGCGGFPAAEQFSALSVKFFPFSTFLFLLVERDKKKEKPLSEGGGMRRVAEEGEGQKIQAECGVWRVVEGVEGFRKSSLGKK